MTSRWAFQKIFHVHICPPKQMGLHVWTGNLISNASKKLCSIHQFACTLVWCPARPAKRGLFNNITLILLNTQPMLTFMRLSIWRHFLPKYHITTKKNKEHSCPYWLPAQRDTSPKMKKTVIYSPSYCPKSVWTLFRMYYFFHTMRQNNIGPHILSHWLSEVSKWVNK